MTAWAIEPLPPCGIAPPIENLGLGNADVGEVDLVELGLAGHLAQRTHLDSRRLHVDDEGGQTGVLHSLGIGPDNEETEAGQVRESRPDFLTVDDPLLAVLDAL